MLEVYSSMYFVLEFVFGRIAFMRVASPTSMCRRLDAGHLSQTSSRRLVQALCSLKCFDLDDYQYQQQFGAII